VLVITLEIYHNFTTRGKAINEKFVRNNGFGWFGMDWNTKNVNVQAFIVNKISITGWNTPSKRVEIHGVIETV
jgi:hypothetical protein